MTQLMGRNTVLELIGEMSGPSSLLNFLDTCITDADANVDRLAETLQTDFQAFEQVGVSARLVAIIEGIVRPARTPVIQIIGRAHRLCRQAEDKSAQERLERHIQTMPHGIQIQFLTSILNNGGIETVMPILRPLAADILDDDRNDANRERVLKLLYRAAALGRDHHIALACLRRLKQITTDDVATIEANIDRHLHHDAVIQDCDPDHDMKAILARLNETGELRTGQGTAQHFSFTTSDALCAEFGWPFQSVKAGEPAELAAPLFFPERHGERKITVDVPSAHLAVLKNAQVVGGTFLTFCDQRVLLPQLEYGAATRWNLHTPLILAMGKTETIARVAEPQRHYQSALHFMSGAKANYFHLMFERVSSLLVLSDWVPPPDCVMLVDAATRRIPQFSEILDLVNRWDLPIVPLAPGETVQVADLHLPSPCGWSVRHMRDGLTSDVEDTHILPEAVTAIRGCISPFLSKKMANRRIFVTRKTARDSRMTNAEAVEKLLVGQFGFEAFDPADHSFHEQVRIFSEAAIAIGPSGSGLVGGMFMQPGTLLVPLLRPDTNFAAWSQLGQAAGVRVINLAGQDLIVTDPRFPTHGHFTVPLQHLEQLLKLQTGAKSDA